MKHGYSAQHRSPTRHHTGRKGVILIGVVFLMAIVLGLLSILMLSGAQLYRAQKVDRMRSVARAMADSGAAYTRSHFRATPTSLPAEFIELDSKPLLPPNLNGSLTLTFLTVRDRPIGRVTAHVFSASSEMENSLDVDLTAPASAPSP